MKTDFPDLIKSIRVKFHPEFKKLESLSGENHSNALDMIERDTLAMILANGYSEEEFFRLQGEHFIDFSSDNPDNWIVRYEPENAEIIIKQ